MSAPLSATALWWNTFAAAWAADWQERRRDWRVGLVLLLGLALAALAATLGAHELAQRSEARELASHAEQQRWLKQGERNPHSAAHYGVYAFKPLTAAAALDPGIEPYVGSSVWLEAHKQNEFGYRPVNDAPGVARQFTLTPAFVLQVLVPLALVFLGFGSLAADRERGSLALLRLHGAPLSALALARAALLFCLGLALAAPAVVAVLAVQADAAPALADSALRLSALAGVYLAYLLGWALAVVAVSAWAPGLMASMSLLIAAWALTALLLPRAATEWAQGAAPLPSGSAFRQQLHAALGEPHDPAEEAREKQALLDKYGVNDVKQLPVNWSGISLQRGEEHGNVVFDRQYGQLFSAMQAQSDAMARWGWLSPTLAVAGLSSAAAATDTAHHVQFVRGAEAHRRLIQKLMNDAITARPVAEGQTVIAGAELWQRVPPLNFRFQPLGAGFARQALPLLAWVAAAALLLHLGLRRLREGALR